MASLDDELLQEAEDDARTVAYIREHLSPEVRERFDEDDLYYILDLIVEYYTTSGILDAAPDKNGYIDIDETSIANYVIEQARKDKMNDFRFEDILNIVELEGDYAAQQDCD